MNTDDTARLTPETLDGLRKIVGWYRPGTHETVDVSVSTLAALMNEADAARESTPAPKEAVRSMLWVGPDMDGDVERFLGNAFESWLPGVGRLVYRNPDGVETTVEPGQYVHVRGDGVINSGGVVVQSGDYPDEPDVVVRVEHAVDAEGHDISQRIADRIRLLIDPSVRVAGEGCFDMESYVRGCNNGWEEASVETERYRSAWLSARRRAARTAAASEVDASEWPFDRRMSWANPRADRIEGGA